METRVVNLRQEPYDIFIGRGSPFGNPYKISEGCNRKQAIESYRQWFDAQLVFDPTFSAKVLALKGKTLGCYCKPLDCHGDVIVEWLSKTGYQG